MAKATWNGVVVAESDQTKEIEGNIYFPPHALKQEYFESSDTTSVCGWKGTANYYNITIDGQTNVDAAWTYKQPKEQAKDIAGYVAFWKGVQVEK